MTGVIEEVIKRAMIEGEIPDETPGLDLTRLPSGDLEIRIGRERCLIYSGRVKDLVDWLRQTRTGAETSRSFDGYARSLEIRRAGTASIIEIKRDGKSTARFSMTGGMPDDVRRQIVSAYKNDRWVSREPK
jgi:hypothetical protein